MFTNIYILRLINIKYYVGKSKNPQKRFTEHVKGFGSAWTKKYKPIEIEQIIEHTSPFDEDKYVKEYMAKYGIDSVRGGSYVTIELTESQKRFISKEIWGATDCCMRCGRDSHFVSKCYAKVDINGNVLGVNS